MIRNEREGNEGNLSIDPSVIRLIGFGPILRAYRVLRDINVVELARKVPCDKSYLSKIEKGERYPAPETAQAIIRALDPSEEESNVLEAAYYPRFPLNHKGLLKSQGEFIRDLREREGLTQRALAMLISCDQSYVSKIEKGQRTAESHLAALTNVLNLTPEEKYILNAPFIKNGD